MATSYCSGEVGNSTARRSLSAHRTGELLSTYVRLIFECEAPEAVFKVLNGFLTELRESPLANDIPAALLPVQIDSLVELHACLIPVRVEMQDQHARGVTIAPALVFMKGVLDAASRRLYVGEPTMLGQDGAFK